MAKSSQFTSVSSSGGAGGSAQAVVELCAVRGRGLIFWARQRFQVGAELQVRLRAQDLPVLLNGLGAGQKGEWVMLRGFVVQCQALRRADGSCGFQVSLLIAAAAQEGLAVLGASPCLEDLFFRHEWLGGRRMGLN